LAAKRTAELMLIVALPGSTAGVELEGVGVEISLRQKSKAVP